MTWRRPEPTTTKRKKPIMSGPIGALPFFFSALLSTTWPRLLMFAACFSLRRRVAPRRDACLAGRSGGFGRARVGGERERSFRARACRRRARSLEQCSRFQVGIEACDERRLADGPSAARRGSRDAQSPRNCVRERCGPQAPFQGRPERPRPSSVRESNGGVDAEPREEPASSGLLGSDDTRRRELQDKVLEALGIGAASPARRAAHIVLRQEYHLGRRPRARASRRIAITTCSPRP